MICQDWFRWWLCAVKQQAISWAIDDPDLVAVWLQWHLYFYIIFPARRECLSTLIEFLEPFRAEFIVGSTTISLYFRSWVIFEMAGVVEIHTRGRPIHHGQWYGCWYHWDAGTRTLSPMISSYPGIFRFQHKHGKMSCCKILFCSCKLHSLFCGVLWLRWHRTDATLFA